MATLETTPTGVATDLINGIDTKSITFSGINNAVLTNVQIKEDALKTAIETLGSNPTTQDLLVLQQKMQEWSMLVELQSTLAKTTAETMKGVIQKTG